MLSSAAVAAVHVHQLAFVIQVFHRVTHPVEPCARIIGGAAEGSGNKASDEESAGSPGAPWIAAPG